MSNGTIEIIQRDEEPYADIQFGPAPTQTAQISTLVELNTSDRIYVWMDIGCSAKMRLIE